MPISSRLAHQQSTRPLSEASDGSLAEVGDLSRFGFGQLLASICVLAFFLRALHVMQTFQVPTQVRLLGDAKGYFDWASRISEGNWYGSETFYQAPLYPYFLAVIFSIGGPSLTLVRLVQTVLGVVGVGFIGLAARKLFSERTGLVAALMLAIYPPAIYYDGIVQNAPLAAFLVCSLVAACAYLQSENHWGHAVLAGVTLGLLVLTRENALLWTPIIPFWMLLGISEPARRRWVLVGCYAVGLASILLPVAARNASFGGEWSPTTFQAGPNFYIGNSLDASGTYVPLVPGHETPMYERADAQRLAEEMSGRELTSREVSQFWMARAWQEIRQAPGRWVQLMLAKSFMVVNRYEVPDVESLYIYREYSLPLQLGRIWHFGVLFPLGIWGLVATFADRRRLWLYYLLLLSMIAAVVMFYILGRYRNPIAILMVPFAAAGVVDLYQRIRFRERLGAFAAATVLLVAGVVCNLPVHEEASLEASCYMNMGIAASQAGDLPLGIQLLKRSIAEFPEMAEGYFNLGRAYLLDSQPDLAIRQFQLALALEPGLVGVHFPLGQAFEQMGERQLAIEQYQRALNANPRDPRSAEALSRLR